MVLTVLPSLLTPATPAVTPLFDQHGRPLEYLRLAVTDRCNLRCFYCMPEEGIKYMPKHELLSMHTARHTFAVLSLMRGLPVAVLQKVLGHAKIQTTMLYAKVVEDFQHQEMRRIWEGSAAPVPAAVPNPVCVIETAVA